MHLNYPADWRFDGFDVAVSQETHREFYNLVRKIAGSAASTENKQDVFEEFKTAFGGGGRSTNLSFAEGDCLTAMEEAKGNAATYVASLWEGIGEVEKMELSVPTPKIINKMLERHGIPLVIDPPDLRMSGGDATVRDETTEEPIRKGTDLVRVRKIGSGGFGAVYHVIRETRVSKFDFAMKVFTPSVFIENKTRARIRFKREIDALRKLH